MERSAAPRFQGLLDDLEQNGYPLKAPQSGGYNPRNIAGTNTPSRHASGNAVDVNWTENDVRGGGQPTIPPFLADSLARQHGLTWGGLWEGKTVDPMHFEVPRNAPATLGERSITAFAGHQPSGAFAAAAPTQGAYVASAASQPNPQPTAKPAAGEGIFSDQGLQAAGNAIGAFAQGNDGSGERLAQMAKAGNESNASALNEEDQRQMSALKAVLARRTA